MRREVIDTLTRDLAVSPNKWSTLMTELSEVVEPVLYFTSFDTYIELDLIY